MSTDYSDSYGQELFAKLYAEYGKRKMSPPSKKICGSRKAVRAVLEARKEKEWIERNADR